MDGLDKTKEELLRELGKMRRRVAELEGAKKVDGLLKDEKELRSTLRAMRDFVFVLDQENRFISSYAPENELYLPPGTFFGKTHAEIMPAHIDELFSAALADVKGGKTASYDIFYRNAKWLTLVLHKTIGNNG